MKIKNSWLIVCICFFGFTSEIFAQNGVGINTSTP